MYFVCIDDECGYVEWSGDYDATTRFTSCAICLSPLLRYTDDYWLDKKRTGVAHAPGLGVLGSDHAPSADDFGDST